MVDRQTGCLRGQESGQNGVQGVRAHSDVCRMYIRDSELLLLSTSVVLLGMYGVCMYKVSYVIHNFFMIAVILLLYYQYYIKRVSVVKKSISKSKRKYRKQTVESFLAIYLFFLNSVFHSVLFACSGTDQSKTSKTKRNGKYSSSFYSFLPT